MTDIPKIQRVAGKAVIEAEGAILVLHPSSIDLNPKWHIPGGIRDDIEEQIKSTATREVLEETGIDLGQTPEKVFKVGEWSAVDKGEAVKILAVFFHFKLPTRPDIVLSEEHDEYAWLNISNYKDYDLNTEVSEIIKSLFLVL